MSDNSYEEVPLHANWTAFGSRMAAAVGAFTALTSLVWHSPVWVASGRGAMAWLVVVGLTRGTGWLVRRTMPTSGTGADPQH